MSNIVIRRISTWCAFMYYVVTNYRILLLYKVFLSFTSSSATDTGEVGSGIKGRLLLKPRAQTILRRTHLHLKNKTYVCKKKTICKVVLTTNIFNFFSNNTKIIIILDIYLTYKTIFVNLRNDRLCPFNHAKFTEF